MKNFSFKRLRKIRGLSNFIFGVVLILPSFSAFSAEDTAAKVSLVVVGNIPNEYLGSGDKNSYSLGIVAISGRVIEAVRAVDKDKLETELGKYKDAKIIHASADGGKSYDLLYPGLINLHNHTKQNNLPIWGLAHGQFENRFEWRDWGDYTKSVSGNMNPWVGFGSPVACATFRWSELMALALGTVYLQGPSSCVKGFGIQQVEDTSSYISKKKAVQAPTDLIVPEDMTFAWKVLGPIIRGGKTYEQALSQVLNEGSGEWRGCPGLQGKVTAENVDSTEIVQILSDQDKLKEVCGIKSPEDEAKLPEKFVRYVYWIHKTVAAKKNYQKDPKFSGMITHLGEGRRKDPYNNAEFKILDMLGLVHPHLNLVHAVGVDLDGLKKMAKNDMGIIWSPFSNLLLYGESLDLRLVRQAENEVQSEKDGAGKHILIALGSDWVPTGTKSVLEEMQVARAYIDKFSLRDLFSDEDLYKMVTENPAKMIGHWDIDPAGGEHGIGRIAAGAMASLIAVKTTDANPYTNLVRSGNEKTVNLVVVDGAAIYGNLSYLKQIGHSEKDTEILTDYFNNVESAYAGTNVPAPPAAGVSSEETLKHLADLGKTVKAMPFTMGSKCGVDDPKALVFQDSLKQNGIDDFFAQTGLNLDRYEDLQRLLSVSVMTQTRNRQDKVDPSFIVKYFPPLLACNEEAHVERVESMLNTSSDDDQNGRDLKARDLVRKRGNLGAVPKKLGLLYQ